MHTRISSEEFGVWIALIAARWITGWIVGGGELQTLRIFLFCGAMVETGLAILAKTIEAWSYFHSWLGAALLHEVFSGFLVLALINRVRARSLPGRGSIIPVEIAFGTSLAFGIYTSSSALRSMAAMPAWRTIICWDHAFWWAICCLVGFVPFYAFCIGATIPRNIALSLAGFGVYAAANAGLLATIIARHRLGSIAHLPDFAICLTFLSWIYASRIKTGKVRSPNAALTLGPSQLDTEKEN